MALPPLQDLLDLLADNSTGDISAQDMQDIVTALYQGIEDSGGGGGGGGSIPLGGLLPWPDSSDPTGFLECNGQAVSRTTYADLFALIGVKYGAGDNLSTFNVPDYRGRFLRVQDSGAGRDPDAATRTARADGTLGDNVGTTQAGAVGTVAIPIRTSSSGAGFSRWELSSKTALAAAYPSSVADSWEGQAGVPASTTFRNYNAENGAETRPINIYVRIFIRATVDVAQFVSAPIVLTAGSKAITPTAHGLGVVPRLVDAYLLCNIADLNYAPSDRVYLGGIVWDGVDNNGLQLSADSINITPIQINDLQILNKTTFALTTITYASWSLYLVANK